MTKSTSLLTASSLIILAGFAAYSLSWESGAVRAAPGQTVAGGPILVEMFTSQGCSSCPPADKVLERLDADANVVAISRAVTYWDRLGWKDTLARPANDIRQRRYAERGLPDGGVFTPEAVVQGSTAQVGSREGAVRDLIAAARSRNPVRLTQSGRSITASKALPDTEMIFLALARKRTVDIGAGENGRRQLGYTNVVLNEIIVACGVGGACSAAIPAAIANQRGADRWAVVLQNRNAGRVQAVRWINPSTK